MKRFSKIIVTIFITLVTFTFSSCSSGIEKGDIVIIYTTDVHCGVDDNIGYSSLSAYVKKTKELNENVTLVDAGDAIQGNMIGNVSKGKYIIDIMNELNYDLYVLGNHEFDYGLDELKDRISEFNGDVISCNVSYTGQNENKLSEVKPYSIVDYGFAKVGYVGVTTPTVTTVSNPSTFKENDEIVYSFAGSNLFEVVQNNIDECHRLGCNYVVLVTHLGYLDNYSPNSSPELIANTTGVDAVIDGHSHQTLPCNYYENKTGDLVPLCTAGYKMNAFGRITITKNGDIHLGIITSYPDKDEIIENKIVKISSKIEEETNQVVATNDLDLSLYDDAGIRMARSREIGLGDLVADSFRYVLDSDIAFVNGGGLRDNLKKGELTYGAIKNVLPFDNTLCIVMASGQRILDYLEFVSRKTESEYSDGTKAIGENGGFAQVSGLKYTIDTSIESSVVTDSTGAYVSIEGQRRVKDVMILENGQYVEIDLNKQYTITAANFILLEGGDGANMFMDCKVIAKNVMLDSEALTKYIVDVLHGNLKDQYENSGNRITIE